jgi:hypothetical protein
MPPTLQLPDLRNTIEGLRKRIEILERRIRPQAAAGGHSHDGAGTNSIVVSDDADADGERSTAVGYNSSATSTGASAFGDNSYAPGLNATAVGSLAWALAASSVAVGDGAQATETNAVAVGSEAAASYIDTVALGSAAAAGGDSAIALGANTEAHQNSVAIGYGVVTTDPDQVNMGTRQLIFGGPSSAPSNADLINSQIAFYLDQAGNSLKVKVKYSDGTVKTGTVALA